MVASTPPPLAATGDRERRRAILRRAGGRRFLFPRRITPIAHGIRQATYRFDVPPRVGGGLQVVQDLMPHDCGAASHPFCVADHSRLPSP